MIPPGLSTSPPAYAAEVVRGEKLSRERKKGVRSLGGAEIVLDALERLDHRARDLRELADDVMVNVAYVRGLVQLLAAKGEVSELDEEIAEVRDARNVLMAALHRGRGDTEEALRMVQEKMLAIEVTMDVEPEEIPQALIETSKYRRSSSDQVDLEPQRVPLPSRPPPEPPPQASKHASDAPSKPPDHVIDSGDDLASQIERHSWNADGEPAENGGDTAKEDRKSRSSTPGQKRLPKPRSRSRIPAARAKKPAAAAKGAGDWEEDFSNLLERGSWATKDAEGGGIDSSQSPRRVQKVKPKDTVENLLHVYLKDAE